MKIMRDENICSYEDLEKYYQDTQCWGLSASIDLSECNPETIRSEALIRDYVLQLTDLIKMKRFQDTKVVHFGEDDRVAGYSMVQLIETSLISGHFSNLNNSTYIDIFSCKIFDPWKAEAFTREFFEAKSSRLNLCFRL